jgi:hypothetical protein
LDQHKILQRNPRPSRYQRPQVVCILKWLLHWPNNMEYCHKPLAFRPWYWEYSITQGEITWAFGNILPNLWTRITQNNFFLKPGLLDPWPFQGPKTKGFFKYSYGKA